MQTQITSRSNLRAAIPLLLVIIVVSGAAALGWRGPFEFAFGKSGLEIMYSAGFYGAERTTDGVSGAWSTDAALMRLPWSEWAGAERLVIRMAAPRPPGQPPPTLYLNLDSRPLATLRPAAQMQDYSIDVSNHPFTLVDANLYINSETFRPGQSKGDLRDLGVFVITVRLEPSGWFVALRGLLVGLMAGALYWLAWRLIGRGRLGKAMGLGAGLGLGLLTVAELTWARVDVALYIWGAAVAVIGAALLIRAADALTARMGGGPMLPLTYAALLFPLLAVVQAVWGRLQLTEFDGAIVAPAVTMLIVAAIGGVALLVAFLYWRNDAARLRLACLIIFLIAAAIYYIACHWFVFAINMHRGNDLRQDYVALLQWQAGGLPYSLSDTLVHPGTAVKLPPIFAYMVLPQMWAGQSFLQLLFGWRVGNELIYLLGVWLTLQAFDIRLRSEAGGAAVWLALCSAQAAETVAWGQFNIIMLASIAGALWLIRKGRLAWSGAALSLAVMLKFFPLTLALPWLVKRRGWTGLGGLVAGFIALALLPIPLLGWDTVYYYWTQIFPKIGGGADEGVSNQSLYGMVARLAVAEANLKHRPPGAWWVLPIVYGSGLTLIVLSAWLAHRRTQFASSDRSEAPASRLLPYLLCLTLGLLISPFSWAHYETVLLPAIVGLMLLIATRSPANSDTNPPDAKGKPPTSVLPLLFGVMFALIGYGGRYDLSGNYAVGLDLLGVSYHSFGLILLWVMLSWMLWRGVATVAGKSDAAEPGQVSAVTTASPALVR